ncbi:MAG TPA: hypothetical protein VMU84_11365 [Thermoanaerobaculia bacterium]|nr:hypothetical protein [Thermoanaerobaculia bacterium]
MIARFLERFDDWINPVTVKELRQAVRGRFVATILSLALLAQCIAIAAIILSGKVNTELFTTVPAGPAAFGVIFTVVFTACLFFVPLYVGVRMVAERSDTNVDLFFITTIKPRTIVFGKLLAVLALVTLIFSASLPFLVFSYVLRGVDLFAIGMLLVLAYLLIASQAVAALFVGCIPTSKPFKIILAFVLLGFSAMSQAPMLLAAAQMMNSGPSLLASSDFWKIMGIFVMSIGVIDALLLVLTIALITPLSANRALPVRITMSILWLVSLIPAALVVLTTPSARELLLVWTIAQCVLVSLVLMSAIGERDRWGPRVAKTIPANPFKRAFAFLFYSGGAGGTLWVIHFFILTIVAYAVIDAQAPVPTFNVPISATRDLIDGLLCVFGYAMTALLLRRTLLQRVPPRATWAIAMAVFILGAIIPPLIVLMISMDGADPGIYSFATIANPFPRQDMRGDPTRTFLLVAWVASMTFANFKWFTGQWRRFKPEGERPARISPDVSSGEVLSDERQPA